MSLKISLAWMGAAQAASFIAQFGCSIVLARYLAPHEMGIFAIAMATVGLLNVVQSFGLQPLIVREEVLTESIAATAFTINALTLVALSLATVACAYLGSSFLEEDGVRRVLLVLSISPLFGILSFLPGAQLERNARFKDMAIATMTTGIFGAITTIVLVVLNFNYMSLAYSSVLSSAVLSVGILIQGRSYFSCRLSFAEAPRVLKFSLHMLAISGVANFANRLCEVLLGRILGLAALGLYSRASGFNNILWGNIHFLAGRVVMVDFAGLRRSGTPLRKRYIQTVAMLTGVLWPAFAGLALLAQPFVVTLFGEPWIGAVAPLRFLALGSMILVATSLALELSTATDNISVVTRVETARAICSLPLFVGACLINLEAVALSRAIDAALAYVLYRPHLNRMSGTRFLDFIGIYAQGAVLTTVAIAPSALLMVVRGDLHPPLGGLVIAVLIGITLWAVALFLLKHPLAQEILATINNRLARVPN